MGKHHSELQLRPGEGQTKQWSCTAGDTLSRPQPGHSKKYRQGSASANLGAGVAAPERDARGSTVPAEGGAWRSLDRLHRPGVHTGSSVGLLTVSPCEPGFCLADMPKLPNQYWHYHSTLSSPVTKHKKVTAPGPKDSAVRPWEWQQEPPTYKANPACLKQQHQPLTRAECFQNGSAFQTPMADCDQPY
ncbi:hypothetical protein P7K49_012041 [Saguinus oedipus]|uniref:Uncharacterized protein n=1 Tax=Saguinus oedipus TaxID=9490 RepID=A0ABQ9VSE3_SAGOE|nr:hypothetical protein P7K49_012041 [Saguinus oedipus]